MAALWPADILILREIGNKSNQPSRRQLSTKWRTSIFTSRNANDFWICAINFLRNDGASDNERIAGTSLLQSASWNDALINFSRGQWSLYVSESRALLADTACWLILHA